MAPYEFKTEVYTGLGEVISESLTENPTTEELVVFAQSSRSCALYRFVCSVLIIGVLCVLGTGGNLLAIAVLSRFRDNSGRGKGAISPTALLLAALAIADGLFLVSLILVKSIPSLCWYAGILPEYLAIYPYLLQWGWPTVDLVHSYSTWITVMVAAQRYVAVTWPHRASTLCTRMTAYILILGTVTGVTLFQLPSYLDYSLVLTTDDNNNTYLSREYTSMGKNYLYNVLYKTTAYYLVMYIIPLMILTVLTYLLIRTLRQAQRTREQMTSGTKQEKKEEDVTRSLVILIIISIVCHPWEPIRRLIEHTLQGQPGCGHFYFYYEEFPSLFAVINASVNVVIYFLSGSRFRNTLKTMCGSGQPNDSLNEQSTGTITSREQITS